MVRTQIQLTEDQASALKKLAATEGVSMAALIRQSIDRTLAEEQPVRDPERIRRALEAIGCIQDVPDLAENHDKYLAEAYSS